MPCPCHSCQNWRQNSVQHPICWACWLSCWTGWSPHLYAVPVLPSLPQALPSTAPWGDTLTGFPSSCGLVVGARPQPEPGSLLRPCPCGGALLGGTFIFGLKRQSPSLGPANGLPGHPHCILGTALPKKEPSGLSGPSRFPSLARPRALRPLK